MTAKSNKITDRIYKCIAIPGTGILAFHLSGFAKATFHTADILLINYTSFSILSFSIWNGIALTHKILRKQLYALKQIYSRVLVSYSITIIISWIISNILLNSWNKYLQNDRFNSTSLLICQVIITVISIQITSIYEIVYLNKERESELLKVERIEKLKVQAQLDALKNQIDPHFIFNSLNTLSYLISVDQGKAKFFNDTLAKVYRYILLNKEKDLVQIKEEIEFASNYFYLLKIRYQTGLSLIIRMDNIISEDYLIPPLSLQALIENAIKHNHFSEKIPLLIEITILEDEIRVVNKKYIKKYAIHSSKIGLSNLDERYSLIINKNISVIQTQDVFTVLLPILIPEEQ